jgi:hypothetical protein
MKTRVLNYRHEEGCYLIELKLSSLQQLFNVLDPAPFRAKDLAPAAEEYIVDSTEEFPLDTPLKLSLHLSPELSANEQMDGVPQAIHNYFAYRAEVTARRFSRVLKQGRMALAIGLGFLFFCILGHTAIAAQAESSVFWLIVEEGILITGWVAMWHPINLFLYEWWPVRHKQRLYEKLAQMEIELQTDEEA